MGAQDGPAPVVLSGVLFRWTDAGGRSIAGPPLECAATPVYTSDVHKTSCIALLSVVACRFALGKDSARGRARDTTGSVRSRRPASVTAEHRVIRPDSSQLV